MANNLIDVKYQPDDDNIRAKEIAVDILINNPDIIHLLHNIKLNESNPDDYVGINIRKSAIYPEVQDIPMNYIALAINTQRQSERNKIITYPNLIVYIFCDERDLVDKDTGISRHDLLAYLIKKEFSYSNKFGLHLEVISDMEAITDTHYMTRTLTFKMSSPNNITDNGKPNSNYFKV